MKGGKAGRGRKSSNAQFGKKKAAAKKKGAPRDGAGAPKAYAKRTTKLGAVRLPDDD